MHGSHHDNFARSCRYCGTTTCVEGCFPFPWGADFRWESSDNKWRSPGCLFLMLSVTPMILMDPKSCAFCCNCGKKNCGNLFFLCLEVLCVCLCIHLLIDDPYIIILYIYIYTESWHPQEYASLTWLPKGNDHHSKHAHTQNIQLILTRGPRLATLLVLKDWFGWWVGGTPGGVGSGHHGSPQQIREENGTLEISCVVSFYRYFTGGGFFKH